MNGRRDLLKAAAAASVAGALAACAGAGTRGERSGARDFVLVHGAWHGGWCWSRVAERLRAAMAAAVVAIEFVELCVNRFLGLLLLREETGRK